MNSTGVAIATSPCQPHHLHCLRVPGTPFLSPSLAPPQGTSGASAISHEATCGWLPACPRLPPSFPPAMPAHRSETHPGPPWPPQGSFLPLPSPPPMPQKIRSPKSCHSRRLGAGRCFHQNVPPCAHLLQVTPQREGGTVTSNVCAWKNTTFREMLAAKDRRGGPVPLLPSPGHETPLPGGPTQARRALGTCRWSGTRWDATPIPPLHPPEGERGCRWEGTAGHHISGQAGPPNLGQPRGPRAHPNHTLGNRTAPESLPQPGEGLLVPQPPQMHGKTPVKPLGASPVAPFWPPCPAAGTSG